MKGAEVLIEPLARGGCAAALMVDGRLQDLVIDPAPDDPTPQPGAIYRAVLGRPMKGLGGAMVDLGGGRSRLPARPAGSRGRRRRCSCRSRAPPSPARRPR